MRPWDRWLATDRLVGARQCVSVGDGAELSLLRLAPRERRHRLPVVLVHGLGGNRHTFHLPGRSLALHLAQQGFDTYVVELRGAGQSTKLSSWDFDDYLRLDIPAVIDAVLATSGADRLMWVGHSMGGILLFAYASQHPDAPIARAVTLGSAVDYRIGASGFKALAPLLPLLNAVHTIPYAAVSHVLAPLVGSVVSPIERFNVHPPNTEPRHTRRLLANGFDVMPTALLAQLATLLGDHGLRVGDRCLPELVARFNIPVLLAAGSVDPQVSTQAVMASVQLLGSEVATARCYGRANGQRHDYGHFDLIMGRWAPEEVWPDVCAWLAAGPAT